MAISRIQKICIAGFCIFFYSVLFQSVILPAVIKSQVKRKVALKRGWRMRDVWGKLPFPLRFQFYMYNVTNPDEITAGGKPVVQEVGPFVYDKWHEKTNQVDHDEDDSVSFTTRDTYYFNAALSGGLTGEEEIIVPHYFGLGAINSVIRSKASATPIVGRALDSILRQPKTLFIKAKVRDILFDGIIIDCNVSDFAGSAVCMDIATNYKKYRFRLKGPNLYSMSLWDEMNATDSHGRLRVYRGVKNVMDVGRVIEYDHKTNTSVWGDDYCDTFNGTDGTIFHPYFDKHGRDDVVAYNPTLCRGISCHFDSKVKVSGLQLLHYTSDLGTNGYCDPHHRCYCSAPGECLRKGVLDLFKCIDAPVIISNPHFYMADPYYISKVDGLNPDKEKHVLSVDIDPFTGAPVQAHTRAQMNMFLTKIDNVRLFKKFPDALLPLLWFDEYMILPDDLIKEIKTAKRLIVVAKVLTYLMMFLGLGMFGFGAYKIYKSRRRGKFSGSKNSVQSEEDNETPGGSLQKSSAGNLQSTVEPVAEPVVEPAGSLQKSSAGNLQSTVEPVVEPVVEPASTVPTNVE